ncbi:MAG: hypothetical protein KGN00_07645 [Chloroflexota bacterium]|nr:hypothetical protein [Chloroflexota bacterium]
MEEQVLDYLYGYYPQLLREIAGALQMEVPQGYDAAKQWAAQVVERLLRAGPGYTAALSRHGVDVKTCRMPQDAMPFEPMTFPAFEHRALAKEQWETSSFRGQIKYLLVVVLNAPEKGLPLADHRLGRAFFWSPDPKEEAGIRAEWEMFRDLIAGGGAKRLPTQRRTHYIHVKPEAKDSYDTEEAPDVGQVVHRSFALNQRFLLDLVRSNT